MLTVDALAFEQNNYSLTPLSFSLSPGEKAGLLGVNGAGKSTLLKLIVGELSASSGDVLLNNKSLIHTPEQTKTLLGYMPDVFPAAAHFTVKELLNWIGLGKGISSQELPLKVNAVIERFDLSELASRRLNQLSLGQRQRVSLAQALLNAPQLLLMDEPLNGLDPAQQESFWQQLDHLPDACICLIASHNLHEIIRYCKRLLLMSEQSIVLDCNIDAHSYFVVYKNSAPERLAASSIHSQILSVNDSETLNQLRQKDQEQLLLSGNALDVLKQLFRLQATGEWQW
ncbi:ABC transporter ATP-binding protein [Pleionea sp. CnH1-48]|uniref:ABC transporter ATP-binding protein n=1 Tax=Pleionea sp. CnH1-48 TaxID=2954494 RepID=UPI0020984D3E|nr:ABC transporter ATP-binding protein [Pleionea sp. CnH1-48]MCO7224459.1 ABC transporter ATP-binding protein [Pleionea sp. CnH1-48]